MIHPYHDTGATDLDITGPAMSPEAWTSLRRNTARLLRARGHTAAADRLDRMPLELSNGINFFGDDFCVLHATYPIEEYAVLPQQVSTTEARNEFRLIARTISEIGPYTRRVAFYPDTKTDTLIPPPLIVGTAISVDRALRDAETLLRTSGAPSAVDRVHTALHAYLQRLCDDAKITYPGDAGITALFKLLREQHGNFAAAGPERAAVQRVQGALATILDALNPVRNHASQAHPADHLLDDADAVLIINAARTILHYLNAKTNSPQR